MKTYRFFLFDLDGTLTDSGEGIMKTARITLEAFGIHVDDWHKLKHFMGPPLQDTFRNFYGFDTEKSTLAIKKFRERYNVTGLWENRVYEGIPELLQDMKASGARLMVATSKPEVTALRVLGHFDLQKYFEVIVGSEMDGRRDRKSEVIKEVFRRAAISDDERQYALMIGDRKHDILGAKEAGIDSLCTYSGYAPPGELEEAGADYIVHSIEELHRLLKTMV